MFFENQTQTTESRFAAFAALVAIYLLFALPAAAQSESRIESGVERRQAPKKMMIAPGQVELLRYSRAPGTVIIGDPKVVTASIAASDILVLSGIETGQTNVIVLDDDGAEIDHVALRVASPGNTVVVRRGQERQLVQCDPACAPLDEAGVATAPSHETVPTSQGVKSPATSEPASAE